MKVTISVIGRFHAFDLAAQLQKRGHLYRLITTYPRFKVMEWDIPDEKITSIISNELIFRGWRKLPDLLKPNWNNQFWLHDRFDRLAVRHVPKDIEIYVGWSSVSERSLWKAKELGAITLLERGSSHIEYQRDILHEEYEHHGLQPHLPHPEIVEKEKREYKLADYIVIPSSFVERTFLDKGFPKNKLIKIPYGVNLCEFKQLPKQDNIFRVVYAGGMSLRKGVHYLLQAFAELNLPNTELWLLGGKLPEIEPFFKQYAGTFRYFGHQPQAKLLEFYSQSSVFVICSIEEGLAMVQPQGMACGLPLICTPNTGGGDLIENDKEGFIVPIRDVESLKEKILYLFEHQDICYEMGQMAKRKIQQGFTWDDYGERVIYAYRRVLQKNK